MGVLAKDSLINSRGEKKAGCGENSVQAYDYYGTLQQKTTIEVIFIEFISEPSARSTIYSVR